MIETKDLYWVAGFLEGEGYFGECGNSSETPRINAKQRQLEPLTKLQNLVKGSIRVEKHKPNNLFSWNCNGRRAVGLMMTLYPLLSPWRQAKIAAALKGWKRHPARPNAHPKLWR